ncbi:hypothetical protein E1264_01225 [Actinomadura sp. KC216]|uniref:hypothetical protein n=1 Tax=Actinomadura sp. KC216 TaxID=2530370 RepID=UPI001053CF24|nr:hypothetical protein [Actinomadura sp. KC216]TDB91602.1 hypothetical protein E1264_01225 [Actinomadura sp. KC216]
MIVTDDQVAALRAQLAGDVDEHRRLLSQLDPKAANVGYVALITAAFLEAVRRRFVKDGKPADDDEIIEFVASVRERGEDLPRAIDPTVAETLIKIALEKLPPDGRDDISGEVSNGHKIVLLAGLTADARLTPAELDAFLARAREYVEEMLS